MGQLATGSGGSGVQDAMASTHQEEGDLRASGGGSGGAGSSAIEAGMPAVAVKVSRFLKHPSGGHTMYECRVELPQTRQVRQAERYDRYER